MVEALKIDISDDGGLYKVILQHGSGDNCPYAGCKVSLHYTGKLADGTIFDSSYDRGVPFEFFLGKGRVIKAFDLGVATMKLGEKCCLSCSPEYAYGSTGSPPSIPPHATLIFELEMLEWKGEDLSPNNDGSIERFILVGSEKKRSPSDGALVKARITGNFQGAIFEDREVQFEYGEGCESQILEGVEIALGKMAVGETSRIKIESKYAFGKTGSKVFDIPINADVEYIVNLINCSKGIEEWKLSTDERIHQATIYKEKGSAYLKKNNFILALKMYEKCVKVLPENSSEKVLNIKIAAKNNTILCFQKTNDFFKGKNACNEVLSFDADNIKALYRRGLCNLALNEFRAAIEDFEKVIELDPLNKAAANQMRICKDKIKECKVRERKIYANMFSKFVAVDKKV